MKSSNNFPLIDLFLSGAISLISLGLVWGLIVPLIKGIIPITSANEVIKYSSLFMANSIVFFPLFNFHKLLKYSMIGLTLILMN